LFFKYDSHLFLNNYILFFVSLQSNIISFSENFPTFFTTVQNSLFIFLKKDRIVHSRQAVKCFTLLYFTFLYFTFLYTVFLGIILVFLGKIIINLGKTFKRVHLIKLSVSSFSEPKTSALHFIYFAVMTLTETASLPETVTD